MNLSTGPENEMYAAVHPSELARTVYLTQNEVHDLFKGKYGEFPGTNLDDAHPWDSPSAKGAIRNWLMNLIGKGV